MGILPADEDYGGFSIGVDRWDIGLNHRRAAGRDECGAVGIDLFVRSPTGGVPGSGRDRRLAYPLVVFADVVAVADIPVGVDDRHICFGEFAQVDLVGVPRDGTDRVVQLLDRAGPRDEFFATPAVIPTGTHHDRVIGIPVDDRIVPTANVGAVSPCGGRDEGQRKFVVEVAHGF